MSCNKKQQLRVYIEICQNCEQHQWCTRHDSAKYITIYNEVKQAIQQLNPEAVIKSNHQGHNPKLGSFEVYCNDVLIFSKIKYGVFPQANAIANLVNKFAQDQQNGKNVQQYKIDVENFYTSGSPYSSPKRKQIPQNFDQQNKSIRGRSSHFTGNGCCLDQYKFIISSTFGQGKRESRSPIKMQQKNS